MEDIFSNKLGFFYSVTYTDVFAISTSTTANFFEQKHLCRECLYNVFKYYCVNIYLETFSNLKVGFKLVLNAILRLFSGKAHVLRKLCD